MWCCLRLFQVPILKNLNTSFTKARASWPLKKETSSHCSGPPGRPHLRLRPYANVSKLQAFFRWMQTSSFSASLTTLPMELVISVWNQREITVPGEISEKICCCCVRYGGKVVREVRAHIAFSAGAKWAPQPWNQGLRTSLQGKRTHKSKGKTLDLQQRKEFHGGAMFWSPRKVREANARKQVKQRDAAEEMLQKSRSKELKAAASLYKKQQLAEAKVERQRLKEVKKQERDAAAA
jgi:hypothetical protein